MGKRTNDYYVNNDILHDYKIIITRSALICNLSNTMMSWFIYIHLLSFDN